MQIDGELISVALTFLSFPALLGLMAFTVVREVQRRDAQRVEALADLPDRMQRAGSFARTEATRLGLELDADTGAFSGAIRGVTIEIHPTLDDRRELVGSGSFEAETFAGGP